MDIESLNSFKKEINAVRDYLLHIQYVDDIAKYLTSELENPDLPSSVLQFKEHFRKFRTEKKLFEYKASIISLYGILEKYVEVWVREYLDAFSRIIHKYGDIDKKIRDSHFDLSLTLIKNLSSRESAKYQHTCKEDILRKLNDCIVNPEKYQLNSEAFVLLSGDLKHNKIVELIKPLNINLNDCLSKNNNLNQEIGFQLSDYQNTAKNIIYNKLDGLVERRNYIAHGSEVSEILGLSELDSYIQFLEIYCQAIFEVLQEELIKLESIHGFQQIPNEDVIDVFGSAILALRIQNRVVGVGDIIIIETPDGHFMKKPILSIEIDKTSHEKVEILDTLDIGLRVDPSIKKNYKFYMSRATDDKN